LGWALNASGVITCKVNGMADRFEDGTWNRGLPTNINTFNPNGYDGSANSPFINDFYFAASATDPHPAVDMMPDEFFYNFAGKSGKIIFDENQIPYTIPFEPIKIQGI